MEEDERDGVARDGETGGMGDGENPGLRTEDSGLSTQHPALSTEDPELRTQNPEPDPQMKQLRAELEGVRSRWLESHRRALLAENAGRIVPELLQGDSVEALEASMEVARSAFEAARATALAELASAQVPAGNPVRQGPSVETMSPMEKIAYGLKRE